MVWERGPRVYERGAPGNAKQALRDQVAKRTDCSRSKAPHSPATSVLLRGLINKVPVVMGRAYALLPKSLLSKRRTGYCHYWVSHVPQQRTTTSPWNDNVIDLEGPPSADGKLTIFRFPFFIRTAGHLLLLGHVTQVTTCLRHFLPSCKTVCRCPDHCHRVPPNMLPTDQLH